MALILVVGTNTWVTLAEANDYLEAKFGADAWAGLTDTIKKQLLISAYRWINNTFNITIPAAIPQALKDAQCELAWWIYNYWTGYEKRDALISGGVTSFTISKFSESLSKQKMPKLVEDLISAYVGGEYFPVATRELD